MTANKAILLGLLFLFGALSFVSVRGWDAAIRTVDSNLHGEGPASPPSGPTAGKPLILFENDSYYWLGFAQQIAAGQSWRVHWTNVDNAPYGRPVHWSNSVSWMMAAAGWFIHSISGIPIHEAIEQGSVFLNPLLLLAFTAWLGFQMLPRFGVVPACLTMGYLFTTGYIQWAFHPLRPDHQTFQVIFASVALLGIAFGGAGWIEDRSEAGRKSRFFEGFLPTTSQAHRSFLAAGIANGLGFWIGAAVQEVVLLVTLISVAFIAMIFRENAIDDAAHCRARLWRLWGRTGALVSLAMYLLEYFPTFPFRLEVNNPLYSLSLLATGELLALFSAGGSRIFAPRRLAGLIVYLGWAILPVGLIFAWPAAHALRDLMMYRFHEGIMEFQSLSIYSSKSVARELGVNLGILPLFLGAALLLARRSDLPGRGWLLLWLSFAYSYAFLILSYFQVRWLPIFAVMNIALAAICSVAIWRLYRDRLGSAKRIWAWGVVLILCVQPIIFATTCASLPWKIANGSSISEQLLKKAMCLRFVQALSTVQPAPKAILADPNLVPLLQYFTTIPSLASYYWENLDGLHAQASILAAKDPAAAISELQRRGIDLICITGEDAATMFFVKNGYRNSEEISETFGARIAADLDYPWRELSSDGPLNDMGSKTYDYRGAKFAAAYRLRRVAGIEVSSPRPPHESPP